MDLLIYIKFIFIQFCLFRFEPAHGGGTTCPAQESAFIPCHERLLSALTSGLQAKTRQLKSINITDRADAELFYETTRDVFCNSSRHSDVNCTLTNLKQCPELLNQANEYLRIAVYEDYATLDNATEACSHLRVRVCSYIRYRFDICLLDVTGAIETNAQFIPRNQFCAKPASTSCMIATYTACPDAVLFNNTYVPPVTKSAIQVEKWNEFTSGTQLCDCYEGKSCFEAIWQEMVLNDVFFPLGEPRDVYRRAIQRAIIVCTNLNKTTCARRAQDDICQNVHVTNTYTHAQATRTTENYWNNRDMCPKLQSTAFETNRVCVVDKLTDAYTPCIQRKGVPTIPTTCSHLQIMYSCMVDALRHRCNGDYVNTVYDVILTSHFEVPVCSGIKRDMNSGAVHYNVQTSVYFLITITTLMFIFGL